jgi:NAD(P)-dependent dehydrogenase (short-subunit alcohol dehydrogenase family)
VNAILPGLIRTPSTEFLFDAPDAPGSTLAAANPLGRVGEADDVAKLAAFLASDDAWYINAAAIPVDGGQSVIE